MANTPNPSGDNRHAHAGKPLRPPSLDPRSQSAIDNLGVDDQADVLDVALDAQPGDRDASGRSFADDVRSDGSNADEDNERR
jgi:hypothetical protein